MKMNQELINKAAVIRMNRSLANDENSDIDFDFYYRKPNETAEMTIKSRYAEILAIDENIANGKIQKVDEAIKQRKIKLSGLINYMVINNIVDFHILRKEGITEKEMMQRYFYHFHTAKFITKAIKDNPFIELELNKLAAHGEPYHTKNGKEMISLWSEIQSILNQYPTPNLFRQLLNERKVKDINAEIRDLTINDEYLFPIENLCCKIQQLGSRDAEFSTFDYRKLSPTSQDRLIGLFVKLYNERYKDEIKEYRADKNRNSKNAKQNINRRTKKLTASDKKDIVQNLKKQGLTYSQAKKQSGFSSTTFDRYW